MKAKSVFVCKECGTESSKWMGKCPGCGMWNCMVEEELAPAPKGGAKSSAVKQIEFTTLDAVSTEEDARRTSGSQELDRVLGGGIVLGSMVLCGGEPGIGKSTLLLQVCHRLAQEETVLYISGEESGKQVKLRAERLGLKGGALSFAAETDIDAIADAIRRLKPKTVVIDSIQTMCSADLSGAPGSVGQVRECTMRMMRIAKEQGVTFFIVGHVTKEGSIAGPRVLEHMVDCVLYFEGERHQSYRIVRAVKNRFGSTNEIGVFEMMDRGLVDVPNPSLMLLSGRPVDVPGSAIVCSMEGTRPILAEIQALMAPTSFPAPRRVATGVDYNRVALLIAVLEKRLGLKLGDQDSYINVTGGIRLDETATDLAVACAIASSFRNIVIPSDMAFFGEVGLTGELRTVTQAPRRVAEIQKMGFKRCMLPYDALGAMDRRPEIELVAVKNLHDALSYLK